MTTNTNESYALITGASGGIGLELAKEFAKNGINLVLVARSENKLIPFFANSFASSNPMPPEAPVISA